MQKLYLTYASNWDSIVHVYNGISEKYAREVRKDEELSKSSLHTYFMQTWMNGVCVKTEFLRHVVFNENGEWEEILDKDYY